MIRRGLMILSVLASTLAAGCMGVTANPSYFPFYLPPGDVVPTHAKPAGQGYFNDFDPKAYRIEISPTQTNPTTGSDVVLIATVFDKDSQPRRSRRVEWILEGPGEILEVDESGVFAGRGYREGNHRAVSYTSYREHNFDRGTRQESDDYTIFPGQTWLIVRSAKPGETVITALAPGINNHEQRTATMRLNWSGGSITSGSPEERPGRSTALEARMPVPGVLTSNSPSGNGQPTITMKAPRSALYNQELTLSIEAHNPSSQPTTPVTLRMVLPNDVEHIRSEPNFTVQNGQELIWLKGNLGSNVRQAVRVTVRPMRKAPTTFRATLETQDGQLQDTTATVEIGQSQMSLFLEGQELSPVGEVIPVGVLLRNDGNLPAENLSLWATMPPGLVHKSGKNPVEISVKTLAPGESKRLVLPVTAPAAGQYFLLANLTGDGISESTKLGLDVSHSVKPKTPAPPAPAPPAPTRPPASKATEKLKSAISLDSVELPATVGRGEFARVRIKVTNRGTGSAQDVKVTLGVSDELKPTRSAGPERKPGTIDGLQVRFPTIPELRPNETVEFVAEVQGANTGQAILDIRAQATGETNTQREEQTVRVVGR
ncbi:MAG: hypothetical protein ACRC8S_01475 [Fimbriiglobus sp.]